MGKKSKAPAGSSNGGAVLVDDAEMQAHITKANGFKSTANELFAKKDFQKALESYQQAASSYPHDNPEKAAMLCNRAACYTMLKMPKEAAKECSNALAISSGNVKALLWRSKAYEAQGLYKQALSDIQSINKTNDSTADTKAAEQRLKDIMSGKIKSAPVHTARATAKPGRQQQQQQQQQLPQFTAKCTFGNDTRVLFLNHNTSYADLVSQVKLKFPSAGNVAIKYKDKDGDMVTVTSRNDIHLAMAEAVSNAEKKPGAAQPTIPPVRFQIIRAPDGTEEVFELDDWLIDFANLFREHLGIGPDRHVDLHNEGWEKCTQALDAAVQSEQAVPLFEQAANRFAEVTASGLYHWGNVHMCLARKSVDQVASTGKTVQDISSQIKAEFDKAEKKYQEALGYKSDFYDGAVGMGQLYFERAKLHTGLLIPTTQPEEGSGKDAQEVANELMKEALKKVTGKQAKVAEDLFNKAVDYFKNSITMLPEDAEAAPKPAPAEGEQEEISFKAQALVMWGNVLYEQSQVRAAVGKDWKPLLDEAVVKFNEAGCQQGDVRTALLNHMKKDEIDIPPEPEKPAEAAKAADAPEAPKGGVGALPTQKKNVVAEKPAAEKPAAEAKEAPKGGLGALPQKKNAKKGGK